MNHELLWQWRARGLGWVRPALAPFIISSQYWGTNQSLIRHMVYKEHHSPMVWRAKLSVLQLADMVRDNPATGGEGVREVRWWHPATHPPPSSMPPSWAVTLPKPPHETWAPVSPKGMPAKRRNYFIFFNKPRAQSLACKPQIVTVWDKRIKRITAWNDCNEIRYSLPSHKTLTSCELLSFTVLQKQWDYNFGGAWKNKFIFSWVGFC